ncbi:hypothetical protein MUN82_16850 [Hymenobacter aerilatus]|uniref:Uncharacterized protein n=1 Tax=Hymenobacter aerilatus TaxID=2932251 RepID=A0A8T9SUG4_9BACT|nr:hypothetical protein [Hymenobacter aerilatus]UOR04604.1 hypothetical protein MUN82_16850 [Hymenobacter aerilatus]
MSADLLLTVAHSFRVPGLGVVALPAEAAPRLLPLDLHTPLAVTVVFPDGRMETVTATVEEIEHLGTARRGLLLEFTIPTLLPSGTHVVSTEAMLVSNNSMGKPYLF